MKPFFIFILFCLNMPEAIGQRLPVDSLLYGNQSVVGMVNLCGVQVDKKYEQEVLSKSTMSINELLKEDQGTTFRDIRNVGGPYFLRLKSDEKQYVQVNYDIYDNKDNDKDEYVKKRDTLDGLWMNKKAIKDLRATEGFIVRELLPDKGFIILIPKTNAIYTFYKTKSHGHTDKLYQIERMEGLISEEFMKTYLNSIAKSNKRYDQVRKLCKQKEAVTSLDNLPTIKKSTPKVVLTGTKVHYGNMYWNGSLKDSLPSGYGQLILPKKLACDADNKSLVSGDTIPVFADYGKLLTVANYEAALDQVLAEQSKTPFDPYTIDLAYKDYFRSLQSKFLKRIMINADNYNVYDYGSFTWIVRDHKNNRYSVGILIPKKATETNEITSKNWADNPYYWLYFADNHTYLYSFSANNTYDAANYSIEILPDHKEVSLLPLKQARGILYTGKLNLDNTITGNTCRLSIKTEGQQKSLYKYQNEFTIYKGRVVITGAEKAMHSKLKTPYARRHRVSRLKQPVQYYELGVLPREFYPEYYLGKYYEKSLTPYNYNGVQNAFSYAYKDEEGNVERPDGAVLYLPIADKPGHYLKFDELKFVDGKITTNLKTSIDKSYQTLYKYVDDVSFVSYTDLFYREELALKNGVLTYGGQPAPFSLGSPIKKSVEPREKQKETSYYGLFGARPDVPSPEDYFRTKPLPTSTTSKPKEEPKKGFWEQAIDEVISNPVAIVKNSGNTRCNVTLKITNGSFVMGGSSITVSVDAYSTKEVFYRPSSSSNNTHISYSSCNGARISISKK